MAKAIRKYIKEYVMAAVIGSLTWNIKTVLSNITEIKCMISMAAFFKRTEAINPTIKTNDKEVVTEGSKIFWNETETNTVKQIINTEIIGFLFLKK
ncbi:hypothetical protein GCM10027429_05480 [Marivirga atlantica]